ncbi:hypothetical protein E2320_017586 [Naja naja]|nr:hypothetical protein E2320_017586 [Naja naja]
MTSTPAFPPFRPSSEIWESYINRFDCFLDAIDVADISAHRKKRRTQAEGETISGYMASLRTAALHCGFRDYLQDMLLDQLVRGFRALRLQRRLLAKGDLTLTMALEESQAAEMSALSAAEIQGSSISQNSSAVHYDEASNEEGSEEFSDINHLRQPKNSQRGNKLSLHNLSPSV